MFGVLDDPSMTKVITTTAAESEKVDEVNIKEAKTPVEADPPRIAIY